MIMWAVAAVAAVVLAVVVANEVFSENGTLGSPTTTATTTTAPSTSTTQALPESQPTSVPPIVDEATQLLDAVEGQVGGFLETALAINQSWESGQAAYDETVVGLQSLQAQVERWDRSLRALPELEAFESILGETDDLVPAIGGIVEGLLSSDTGQIRRAAANRLRNEALEVLEAISLARPG